MCQAAHSAHARQCVPCQVDLLPKVRCMGKSCALQGLGRLTLWALALHSSTSMRSSLLLHPSTSMCSLSNTSARPFLRSPILLSMASAGQSHTLSVRPDRKQQTALLQSGSVDAARALRLPCWAALGGKLFLGVKMLLRHNAVLLIMIGAECIPRLLNVHAVCDSRLPHLRFSSSRDNISYQASR